MYKPWPTCPKCQIPMMFVGPGKPSGDESPVARSAFECPSCDYRGESDEADRSPIQPDFVSDASTMDEEYKITHSPLSQSITRDGITVEVQIYRGESDAGWILEVVDETAASTVWDEAFQTDKDALKEFLRTIGSEGIRSFSKTPDKKLR